MNNFKPFIILEPGGGEGQRGDKSEESERVYSCNVCDKAFKSLPMPNQYNIWQHSGHVFVLRTARVRFTCGPRVSRTGAAGTFYKYDKYDKLNAATFNNSVHSSNKSDKVIEDEAKI